MKSQATPKLFYPLLIALSVTWSASVCAQEQSGTVEPGVVQSKAEQLKQLEDLLNDPDPLIRIAAMDGAMKSDDPLMRRMAMKTGLNSSDPEMLTVALAEWFRQNPTFDVTFEGTQQFLEADEKEQKAIAAGESRGNQKINVYRQCLNSLNSGFVITMEEVRPNGDIAATIKYDGKPQVATGKLVGTSTRISVKLPYFDQCKLDLNEMNAGSYVGKMTCRGGVDWAGGVLASVKLY